MVNYNESSDLLHYNEWISIDIDGNVFIDGNKAPEKYKVYIENNDSIDPTLIDYMETVFQAKAMYVMQKKARWPDINF